MTLLGWTIFEIIINFIEISGSLYFVWLCVKNEGDRFISISTIILVLIGTVWLSAYGFFDFPYIPDIVPVITCVFLYMLLRLKTTWMIAAACSLLNIVILGILTYCVDNIFSTFLLIPHVFFMVQDAPRLSTMIVAHVLWMLVWTAIIRWFRPSFSMHFTTKHQWVIAMVPLLTLILVLVLLEYARAVPVAENNIAPLISALIGGGLLLLNVGALYLYNQMTKQAQEAVLWQAQNQIGDMALQYKAELEQLTYEIRRFRHDFNNHIHTLQGFTNINDYDALRRYLNDMSGELRQFSAQINTGNHVLDILLSGNAGLAKQEGIDVSIEGSVPAQLPISDQHLCVLMGNLFSNAYEACQRIDEREKRFIHIQAYTQGNNLFILMENTTNGIEKKLAGRWLSTKPNAENHGFGLLSIDTLVKQYHGYCEHKHQNNVFTTTIVLPLANL